MIEQVVCISRIEHYLKPLTNTASLPNVKCRCTCYSGKCTGKFDQIDSIISLRVYIHINISISEITISLYKERNQSLGKYLKCFCSYQLLGTLAHLNSSYSKLISFNKMDDYKMASCLKLHSIIFDYINVFKKN